MNKFDRLKSSIKRNKIILSICLVLIVICVSCLTYSYAIKKQDNDLPEVKEDNKFNEVRISSDREIQLLIDGAYYDIVASMDVFKIELPKEDVVPINLSNTSSMFSITTDSLYDLSITYSLNILLNFIFD